MVSERDKRTIKTGGVSDEREKPTLKSSDKVPEDISEPTVKHRVSSQPDRSEVVQRAPHPKSKPSSAARKAKSKDHPRKSGSPRAARGKVSKSPAAVASATRAGKQSKHAKKPKGLQRALDKLPIPTLGQWTPLAALTGIIGMTIFMALGAGIIINAIITGDALNPFAEDSPIYVAEPIATPNPEFEAEVLPMWQGTDRVTVLLLGADTRANERILQPRTDTIMILQLNPVDNHASILSIPRDLYLEVPGYGLQRVNTAYVFGGGPLAVETIEYNLGVRIDYYALVRFQVVIDLIDEIGGIDIYVPKTINDPTFPDLAYGYDPLYIEAGEHHLNGYDALRYARTRHADSDYQRAERQQAVMLAAKDKVTRLDMLPTLVARAPALYDSFEENITTDMTLEEIIQLGTSAAEIEDENIRNCVINQEYITGYTTSAGAQVGIPRRDKVGDLISYVFWFSDEGEC